MQDSLIDQGLSLMLYGMGTVFVFLTVLVGATILMSSVANRFASEPENPTADQAGQPSPQIREAIAKAIAMHRQG